jgi:hypothetical protein
VKILFLCRFFEKGQMNQSLPQDTCMHIATFLTAREAAVFAKTCKWCTPEFWGLYYKSCIKPQADPEVLESLAKYFKTETDMVCALVKRCFKCKRSTDTMLGKLRMCYKCAHPDKLVAITGPWLFNRAPTWPCLEDIVAFAAPHSKIVLPPVISQRSTAPLYFFKPLWLQGCPTGTRVVVAQTLVVRASVVMHNLFIEAGANDKGYCYLKAPEPVDAKPAVQMAMQSPTQILEMRNCRVKSLCGTGVLLQKGVFKADSVLFHECAYAGMCLATNVCPSLPEPQVQNCVFDKIGTWAVQVEDDDTSLKHKILKTNTLLSDGYLD